MNRRGFLGLLAGAPVGVALGLPVLESPKAALDLFTEFVNDTNPPYLTSPADVADWAFLRADMSWTDEELLVGPFTPSEGPLEGSDWIFHES